MDSTLQTLDVEKRTIQKLEESKIQLEEKIKKLEASEEDMQKLLTGYECEKADQANAAMVEMAKKLMIVVTKLKGCLEIHKEFIDKLLIQLKEKEEQLQKKKQAKENMDAAKSDQTSAEDAKVKNDLFKLVEKLRIELQKKDKQLQKKDRELKIKDEELAKEKDEKQKLSTDLELEKERADQADELKTELANAHKTNAALQKSLWYSFPSESFNYYIKVKVPSASGSDNENLQYRYLYVDKSDQLRLDDRPGLVNRSQFVFTRNSNGTFYIYSIYKKKYLQTQISFYFSRVIFSADEDSAEEFVLFFHPQNQHPGLLVNICSLAGSFLLHMDYENCIVDKFLIVPADEW